MNPIGWLPLYSLLPIQACVCTSVELLLICSSHYIYLGEAGQLLGCTCQSAASVWYQDMMHYPVSSWLLHILYFLVVSCLMMCLL